MTCMQNEKKQERYCEKVSSLLLPVHVFPTTTTIITSCCITHDRRCFEKHHALHCLGIGSAGADHPIAGALSHTRHFIN